MCPRHKTSGGFTFVEVIAVLVIVVIVTAVIIGNSRSGSTDLVTQVSILKTHIRYAQSMSMGGSDPDGIFGMKCDTNFYWMFKGTDPDSNIVMLIDDQQYNTNDDGKLDLNRKKIDITAFTLFFDHRGIPYNAYTSETTNTPLASDFLITATPDNQASPTEVITITQHTGFIS